MKIAITGSSGQLGALVIEALLEQGTPASDVVAIARTPSKVRTPGIEVRRADYDDPASLDTAFAGIDRLLLVSGNEIGRRHAQHSNVIAAAKRAGVGFLAYTSLINAGSSSLSIADEHRSTEAALAESGIPFTVLRNGWYTENYVGGAADAISNGAILSGAGTARIAAAPRKDYAEAAAQALRNPALGAVLELGGAPFTIGDVAALLSELSGRPVEHRQLEGEELVAELVKSGAPAGFAEWTAASDAGIALGDLDTDSEALAALLGRRPTDLRAVMQSALGS